MKRALSYDKKYLIRCLIIIVSTMALMKTSGGTGFVFVVPFMLYAMVQRKAESLLFWVLVSTLMLIGNGNLMPKNSIFGYAQRSSIILIGGVGLFQLAGLKNNPIITPFISIIPYLIYMIFSSINGWCPFVSFLKLFLFLMVFFAYYSAANNVSNAHADNTHRIRSVFLSISCFVIFGSMVLLVFFPSLGQMQTTAIQEAINSGGELISLFCGITFHSQALGPLCAMLGVALFADMVFGVFRADKLYVALLVCVPIIIWKTSSRTAMGSFFIGIAICLYFVMQSRGLNRGWKSRVINFAFMVFIAVMSAILAAPSIRNKVGGFVLKYSHDKSDIAAMTTSAVLSSRQGQWDYCIANFKKSPIIGNGFQVDESMIGLKPSFSILSAPVEKSIWISAVLEEGGVIGFAIFLAFMLNVIFKLRSHNAYIGLSCFVVFLITNLGEFTMFSMSGVGGCAWAITFVGVVMDARRIKEKEMMQGLRP